MNVNSIEININILEKNQDIKILEYQIKLNGILYKIEDLIFIDHYDQIVEFQQNLSQLEFLALIVNRCKVIPINLFKICIFNDIVNNEKFASNKISDKIQQKISDLIVKATNESIKECYQIIKQIDIKLKQIVFLHQLIMVDSYTKLEQRIDFIQDCINFLKQYKCDENLRIEKYIKEKYLFVLNDLYRLQSTMLRKDLCQQTLFLLQQQSSFLENKDIQTRIIRLQLDFNQAEYIFGFNTKVKINMQNISEMLQTFKLLEIYDQNKKLHQIPVLQQSDNLIIFQINDYLTKIVQIIFGCLQLQENSLFGELLSQHQKYFQMIPNIQIRYTYHICLSLSLQKNEALENSIKAFNLALEINDLNDIIEIFINTQLLYIETDKVEEGLKFSMQFLENFGSQKIKLSHKAEFKQIEDNMTYMMVKNKIDQ